MGNPTISNGSKSCPEILDEDGNILVAAVQSDPSLKIIDKNGRVTILQAGSSFGLGYDLCPYTVEKP